MKQQTIKQKIVLEGVGIHSGLPAKIVINPAKEGSGIVFDKGGNPLKALVENVRKTERGTTLGDIAVTEHLLAALFGLGIDNVLVEVFGDEVPVMDGSALPFVKAIEEAGIESQSKEKALIEVKKTINIEADGASVMAGPFSGFKVEFMVEFPVIGAQTFAYTGGSEEFIKEIAPARTFGYIKELEALKKRGLAKGASLDNALAIGEKGFINKPRFPDEPVRHKVLDLIGDLALAGRPIRARIVAKKTGHSANIELVRRILCST